MKYANPNGALHISSENKHFHSEEINATDFKSEERNLIIEMPNGEYKLFKLNKEDDLDFIYYQSS